MGLEDYQKALKAGKKDYQARMMKGELPTLAVLDDILPPAGEYSSVSLGLVQIPVEQIVGTKSAGRSTAFASNFMPILKAGTEFSDKWASLSTSHVEEGIRDPIKAYEYMNKFYVEEGNKRVSVMKYFDAVTIAGYVTRIIPKRTEEKENKIYYEFLDFYEVSQVNYIWFSEEGNFAKLQKAVGKESDEVWSHEDQREFSSLYARFSEEYSARGGNQLSITQGDAFLAFIELYGYRVLCKKSVSELKELVAKSWEEFTLLEQDDEVALHMNPNQEKKPLFGFLNPSGNQKLKVAFIYEKTISSSGWTYSHELGRLHLEQTFPDEISTIYYENGTAENAETLIFAAIKAGCNLIFTTTPTFVQASVKAAIQYPEVRILNCSVYTAHRYIRTYYTRMHEIKFLMGAIAGAMAENDRIFYIADYPIYGSISNINAFAMGAKMINPRSKVYLEWSSRKDCNITDEIRRIQPSCISEKDMMVPEDESGFFGLYHVEKDGTVRSLAMPLRHWGKFYEQLIRTIMDGTWKYDDNTPEKKAINYWWGMSAGVLDVLYSKNLPLGTKRLVEVLRQTICSGSFYLFSGIMYDQNGTVKNEANQRMSPDSIATMDWLVDNIIGTIPKMDELYDYAKPVTNQQGVEK